MSNGMTAITCQSSEREKVKAMPQPAIAKSEKPIALLKTFGTRYPQCGQMRAVDESEPSQSGQGFTGIEEA